MDLKWPNGPLSLPLAAKSGGEGIGMGWLFNTCNYAAKKKITLCNVWKLYRLIVVVELGNVAPKV